MEIFLYCMLWQMFALLPKSAGASVHGEEIRLFSLYAILQQKACS